MAQDPRKARLPAASGAAHDDFFARFDRDFRMFGCILSAISRREVPSNSNGVRVPEAHVRMSRCRPLALFSLATCLLMTALAPAPVSAGQVRLVNLEQMTERAARIFSGRCTSADVVFDPDLGADVIVATFRVERAIKGVTGRTATVRMPTAAVVSGASGDAREMGSPFRKGDEVVLFLYGESAQGMSAPVGLGQGHFKVLTDKQGRRHALNQFGNRNLLTGVRPEVRARLDAGAHPPGAQPSGAGGAATESGDLDPAALLDTVETLVAERSRR
jgi:hypothetical protein